jgi:hypothetical protein
LHEDRLLVVTMPDGRTRELADNVYNMSYTLDSDNVAIVRSDDARIVTWQHPRRRGLWLAAIDSSGHVRARSRLHMGKHVHHVALDEGLLGVRVDRNVHHDEWQVLELSPRATVRRRKDAQTDAVGLVGARFDDGVLLAAVTSTTNYIVAPTLTFHTWKAELGHRYLHATASTDWRSLLGEDIEDSGDGDGGYDVAWLTRPERAAILVWPTGDNWGRPQLIPVRAPCP